MTTRTQWIDVTGLATERFEALVEARARGPLVVLTGAGMSAESGIPTFRGGEGFWTVGSRHYQPEEMATRQAFDRMPDEVWRWYLYRRALCRAAQPNAAHVALAKLDRVRSDRLLLVTQNVDGLHLRAGSHPDRTFQIHGQLDRMRCLAECAPVTYPVPAFFDGWPKDKRLDAEGRSLLRCPRCGAPARPHVLWFDETYDEARYRFQSSLLAVERCAGLVVVGTSGTTNLPAQMVRLAARRNVPVVVINPEPTPFTELARSLEHGLFVQATAVAGVPVLMGMLGG